MWAAVPFSRGSSQPRDGTHISHIAGRFFTIWTTREVLLLWPRLLPLFSWTWVSFVIRPVWSYPLTERLLSLPGSALCHFDSTLSATTPRYPIGIYMGKGDQCNCIFKSTLYWILKVFFFFFWEWCFSNLFWNDTNSKTLNYNYFSDCYFQWGKKSYSKSLPIFVFWFYNAYQKQKILRWSGKNIQNYTKKNFMTQITMIVWSLT